MISPERVDTMMEEKHMDAFLATRAPAVSAMASCSLYQADLGQIWATVHGGKRMNHKWSL